MQCYLPQSSRTGLPSITVGSNSVFSLTFLSSFFLPLPFLLFPLLFIYFIKRKKYWGFNQPVLLCEQAEFDSLVPIKNPAYCSLKIRFKTSVMGSLKVLAQLSNYIFLNSSLLVKASCNILLLILLSLVCQRNASPIPNRKGGTNPTSS